MYKKKEKKKKKILLFIKLMNATLKCFASDFIRRFFFFHVKAYLSVTLILDDINDESPVFDYPSYQILIPEVHLPLIDFAY